MSNISACRGRPRLRSGHVRIMLKVAASVAPLIKSRRKPFVDSVWWTREGGLEFHICRGQDVYVSVHVKAATPDSTLIVSRADGIEALMMKTAVRISHAVFPSLPIGMIEGFGQAEERHGAEWLGGHSPTLTAELRKVLASI
jgi:hypothetical protein